MTKTVLLCALFLLACPSYSAYSQSQGSSSSGQLRYAGSVLSDFTDRVDMKDRFYFIDDPQNSMTRTQVEAIIRSGKLHPYLSKSARINMGYKGGSGWLVFPISSISSSDNWKLSLGNQFKGRYSTLKAFSLYDMNTGKYIFDTDTMSNPSLTVPETFRISAHPKTTTYLIAYVRTAPAILTILSPELVNPKKETPFQGWMNWLVTAVSLAGLISMLAIYKTTRNTSYLFVSVIWLCVFIRHVFVTTYLYTNFIQTDTLIPLTWIITPFMIIGALWTSPGAKDDLPASLIIGSTCMFLISCITGMILMHPLPHLATFLLYGPIGFACVLTSFSTWPFIFAGRRTELLCLATSTLFMGLMIFWIMILSIELIDLSDINLMVSEILLCLSILSSAFFASARRENGTTLKNLIVKNNSFEDDSLDLENSPLKEAKEISEHKRLIQVLERERKNMADMQLQSARQTEEMRKSKEAADEANRAKSAFLAIVSHEIRTPMTGIMGMIRLLQDTQISKEQREYVSTIKDSGDAMLALLNDILDYEKIESGKMELEIINCDIRRLARTIHTLMTGHAASKNVELILELDPTVPTWIKCDPTRLRQVILNLLNNAIKFTSKGNVYLRIRNLTSEELSKQGMFQLYFAIQDSGIGISPEQQKKLFMPFAQANTSISRKFGGTGLGLAICKRLIETMGGGISISSKEGEGSTFFFTLDLPAGEEGKDEGQAGDNNAPLEEGTDSTALQLSKTLNALVVDDNGINQKVVGGFLNKLGATFETAGSGQEALEELAKNQFDLIFLDIELPDMSGMEVANRIRNHTLEHKAGIPIVALSGNVADTDLMAYRHSGMNDFAPKPITLETLAEMLLKADQQKDFAWNTEFIRFPAHNNSEKKPASSALDEHVTASSSETTTHDVSDFSGTTHIPTPHSMNIPIEHTENFNSGNVLENLRVQGQDSGFVTVEETHTPLTPLNEMAKNLDAAATSSHISSEDNEGLFDPEDARLINTNTDFLDLDDINLDEDEDSFESAVRRFEEKPPETDSSQDVDPESLAAYGLDEIMLTSLATGLPADTMHEILIGFYEKTDELVAAIGTAFINGNPNELRARAHELKGMAGNFGFKELSHMCAHIENSARNEDLEAAKEATQHLGERYAVARGRLTQWLAEK
ncbi:MAG TPA: ATP-binding protein [Alphaproteobacteria bacterium]|nr:response regulator [Alphaproteobacteria bacterium]HOO50805.1 ATP-binding protein [Alphaproteobacteria bacterium]